MERPPPSMLVLGASSDIGTALVKVAAAAGCPLVLAARDALRLHDVGKLLSREHGIEVSMLEVRRPRNRHT
jgi:short-subunit dehydrogenase